MSTPLSARLLRSTYVTEKKGQERQDSFSFRKSYRKPSSKPVPMVPEDDYVDGGVFQKSTARIIGEN